MNRKRLPVGTIVILALGLWSARAMADEPGSELISLVINLLADKDKDVRAIGLEQVRTEAKGPAATRQFAAQLSKLPAEAQVGLLSALADRGDAEARAAVLEMLGPGHDEPVRVAAIQALGALGQPDDLKQLVELLSSESKPERAAARASLVQLRGDTIAAALAAELQTAAAPLGVTLIEILTERHARDGVPAILAAAVNDDATLRAAAMTSLGQLAGPEHVAGMLRGILKSPKGPQRDAAERAVAQVCNRNVNSAERAEPLLAAFDALGPADRPALLSTLGRVGGTAPLELIEAAIADSDPMLHDLGLRALCNWPDASIALRLIELAESDAHVEHRALALAALIRVAPLPDMRPDAERLALLQKALSMCRRDEEQNLVIKRAQAVRTLDALHFVAAYLDQPAHAEQACETIVEMAHHREFREPNKAEFDALLDRVMQISKDATVVDRANRYKKGQTWVRPKPAK